MTDVWSAAAVESTDFPGSVQYPLEVPRYVQLHGVITVTVDPPVSDGSVDEGWLLPLPWPWETVLVTDPWNRTRLLTVEKVREIAVGAQRNAHAFHMQEDRILRKFYRGEARGARWWAQADAALCKFFAHTHMLSVGLPEEGPGMPALLEMHHPGCAEVDHQHWVGYACVVDWELEHAGYDAFTGGPPLPQDPGFYPVEHYVNYYPGGPWGDREVDTGLGVVAGPGIGD